MARKVIKKSQQYLARLVTGERAPCAFCLRDIDDEVTYGKLYAIGDIQCHYFCCLLSCCLIQKGSDEEGLFGFMYTDIRAEVERCKKHKCSYCGLYGANLGCCVGACRKQFHVPCGRDKNAVSLYYGSYKSYCQQHAPKQKIPDHIMAKARLRMRSERGKGKPASVAAVETNRDNESAEESVCVICYEPVDGFPTVNTFWPPCCAKDAWFHRSCLQRMALSAGIHYLKCPLCNDKEIFHDAVVEQGYYVPDRDAAWELEQNAFAEIYERVAKCAADPCLCPLGRSHDDSGQWDIKLCLLCGSTGAHARCIDQSQLKKPEPVNQSETVSLPLNQLQINESNPIEIDESRKDNSSLDQSNLTSDKSTTSPNKMPTSSDKTSSSPDKYITSPDKYITSPDKYITSPDKLIASPEKWQIRFVCLSCLPAAPKDLDALASSVEALIQQEQAQSTSEVRRPLMPTRMSIRRTKGRRPISDRPSSSRHRAEARNESSGSANVVSSRLELNLKTPRRPQSTLIAREAAVESSLLSPVKLLEQSFKEKMICSGVKDAVLDESIVEALRRKFRKPRPLCERKRIVNNILDGIFDSLIKNSRQKTLEEWCSPKKRHSSMEESKVREFQHITESLEEEKTADKENYVKINNTHSNDLKNDEIEGIQLNHAKIDNDNKIASDSDVIIDTKSLLNKQSKTNNSDIQNKNNDDDQTAQIDEESLLKSQLKNNVGGREEEMEFNSENCKSFTDDNVNTNKNKLKIKTDKKRKKSIKLLTIVNDRNNVDIDLNGTGESKTGDKTFKKSFSESVIENVRVIEIDDQSGNYENVLNKKDKSNKKSLSLKRQESRNKNKKDKETTEQKVRSKSESSTNINIFKRLLTEEDLCSQLLLELTTGKHNDENIDKNSGGPETQNITDNTVHKPKEIFENDDAIQDTPKHKAFKIESSVRSHEINNLNKTSKNHNADVSIKFPKHVDTSKSKIKLKDVHRKTKSVDRRTKDVDPKTKDVERKTKDVDRKTKDVDRKTKDVDRKTKDVDRKTKDVDRKTKDVGRKHAYSIHSERKHKDVKTCDKISKHRKRSKKSKANKYKESRNSDPKKCSTKSPNDKPNRSHDTPKHKTIDIQQDSSLEISGNDQHINIDVIKMEDTPTTVEQYKNLKIKTPEQKTCMKFSPIENKPDKTEEDIDVERFKKEYLKETDRDFKCKFKHKHVEKELDERKFLSPIDFALDVALKDSKGSTKNRKRKLSESGLKLVYDKIDTKKRRTSKDVNLEYDKDFNKITDENTEKKASHDKHTNEHRKSFKDKKLKRTKQKLSRNNKVEVTVDSSEKLSAKNKRTKKIKTKFAIRDENIKLKIKWKRKEFSLNIESKKKLKKKKKAIEEQAKFTQYVLQFPEGSSKEILVKPEKEVSPLKRKYIKNEKTPDNLKQMSIQSFFKLKTEQ